MDIFEGLNEPQRRAVENTEGPLLVLAGAGSGKTRVLTHRVAHLIANCKVPPESILAVTFTNKAAEEMRQRVFNLVGTGSGRIWVMTFHSACVRILREDGDAIGVDRRFTIYDSLDQVAAVRRAIERVGLSEKQFNPKGVLSAISSAKNDLRNSGDYEKQAADFWSQSVAKIYREYQGLLDQNRALDFDDLIMKTVILFRRAPQILDKYQERFRYILIDEYQDTNHAQYTLVNLLASKYHNLCVVGDDDQSIYGFRKADIRNILEFERDYPQAAVVKLEQNYRSTGIILDSANEVVRHNIGRKSKRLWTENPPGEPLTLHRADDEQGEAHFLASEISRLTGEEGRRYCDFAVLYRTNAQSRVVEEAFISRGIPYRVLGGLRFYDRKEIRDLLAYLRLVHNPADLVSFERAVTVPRRGVGDTSLERFENFIRFKGLSVLEALRKVDEVPGLTGKARDSLAGFGRMLGSLATLAETLSVSELADRVLDESGYRRELQSEGTIESESRLENLAEFFSVTHDFESRSDDKSLGAFLEAVSLVADVDAYNRDADAVVMMTLHSAKGLEFPVVFMVGMEEGIFPHDRAMGESTDFEEERRLCYVGITRARERLYMTNASVRTLYGNTNYTRPSRFIGEIPAHLVQDSRTRPSIFPGQARAAQMSQAGRGPSKPAAEAGEAAANLGLRPGDRVNHPKFGTGTVVAVKGSNADASVTVAFPGLGLKDLILAYAPLTKA